MKESVKRQWIEELGKRKQGRGYLRHTDFSSGEDRYCCIGVLIDILWPDEWKESVIENGIWSFHNQCQALVQDLGMELGLFRDLPEEAHKYIVEGGLISEPGYSMLTTLYLLNDGGASFSEIAEFIEKFVETDEGESSTSKLEDLINE